MTGRDLDEAVARALLPELDFIDLPPFSRDWNWAFWAAEKAGLIPAPGQAAIDVLEISVFNNGWEVHRDYGADYVHAEAPTGPEAICRAVLRKCGVSDG